MYRGLTAWGMVAAEDQDISKLGKILEDAFITTLASSLNECMYDKSMIQRLYIMCSFFFSVINLYIWELTQQNLYCHCN